MKEKIIKQNTICVFLAFLIDIAFSMKLDIVDSEQLDKVVGNSSHIVREFYNIMLSINGFGLDKILLGIMIYIVLKNGLFQSDVKKNEIKVKSVLAIFFSGFCVTGYSYLKTNSMDFVLSGLAQKTKSLFCFICFGFLFYSILGLIFNFLRDVIEKDRFCCDALDSWCEKILGKRTVLVSFLIILLVWLPRIIVVYPGLFMGDTRMQIYQTYGIWKYSSNHPIIHTVLQGMCVKFGDNILGSQNMGMFIYMLIQCFLNISILAYSIKRVYESKLRFTSIFLLLIYCFLPFYKMYAVLLTKDSVFTPLVLLWVIYFTDLIKKEKSEKIDKRTWVKLFVVSILVFLFRKNGIHMIIISMVAFFFFSKKKRPIIAYIVCVLVLYTGFNFTTDKILKIEAAHKEEMLSIPFQQTARYIKFYPKEVTKKEREAIDKVLAYDRLAEIYNPIKSDQVKGTFRQGSTSEELTEYFKVWFEMFKKHPDVYISATANNYYGYFYYGTSTPIVYNMSVSKFVINQFKDDNSGLKLDHYYGNKYLNKIRDIEMGWNRIMNNVPGVSLFLSSAIYQWIMAIVLAFFSLKKRKDIMVAYAPFLSIFLVNMAGPTNGIDYFRYEYPIAFGMFYLVIWSINEAMQNEEETIEQK